MKAYNKLQEVLVNRYQKKRLANLYILQYNSDLTNPDVWIKEFLSKITPLTAKFLDHPDVLTIKRSEDEKDYKVDGALWSFFQNFIQYKPIKLKNKFVFVYDAHRISEILSNKLLKTFEDTPKELTIFLFLKDQSILLPTILSRSILLKIFSEENRSVNEHPFDLKNPNKVIDEIKILEEGETAFINSVINNSTLNNLDYKKASELLKAIESHNTYSEFNNSQLSRIALILP